MTNFVKGHLAKGLGLSTIVLGGAMGATVLAQASAGDVTTQSPAPAASSQTSAAPASSSAANGAVDPNDSSTYATGKPLQGQSKEGFWGHMNPFARKKWVAREVDPIKDRTNELDQLQAKNSNDIKDVDSRAQSGIHNALMAANTADQHASDAANRANQAQTTATGASAKTDALNGTVSNLDQYSQVTAADVKFAAGRTTLGPQGKAALDDMALKLANEKGYIIEVQGYSRSGVATSQAMADSVVRYLVTDHQVPLYRVYRTGLGRAEKPADGETALINGVHVALLHNSLASLGSSASNNSEPSAAPGQTAVPSATGSSATQ